MVAAGLNAVRYACSSSCLCPCRRPSSIYVHQGLSNPSPGVVSFEHARALQPVFDAAKQAGIFIVLRPGPYINAETTAGGLALWATSLTNGTLRTNDTGVMAGWQDYIEGIAEQVN